MARPSTADNPHRRRIAGRPSRTPVVHSRCPERSSTGVARQSWERGKIGHMPREYASLRRKTFFLPFLVGGFLGILVLALGFWLHGRIVSSAATTLVVVTRHAEKDLSGGDDPNLTAEGMARAARLAANFPGRAGQLGFDRVYVTQWRRSVETARPTLAQSGALLSRVEADAPAALVQQIRTQDGGRRVLVVAHSDTVPAIVHGLAPTAQIPEIASTEYGTVYVIAVPRTGQATVLAMHIP